MPPFSRLIVPLLLVACLLSPGCVRRRMTIRSNPDGATVYVDDQEIGTTPVSASYNYYGTRKIQLVRDGYETLTVMHKFQQPWYQFPPLDFVTENLLPREVRDEQIVDIELEPQRVVPTPELLNRAQQLRQSTRQGYTVLPPPARRLPTDRPPAPVRRPLHSLIRLRSIRRRPDGLAADYFSPDCCCPMAPRSRRPGLRASLSEITRASSTTGARRNVSSSMLQAALFRR